MSTMNTVRQLIINALKEDLNNSGDHSSLACIPKNKVGSCQLLVKEKGIIAGIDIAQLVFNIFRQKPLDDFFAEVLIAFGSK